MHIFFSVLKWTINQKYLQYICCWCIQILFVKFIYKIFIWTYVSFVWTNSFWVISLSHNLTKFLRVSVHLNYTDHTHCIVSSAQQHFTLEKCISSSRTYISLAHFWPTSVRCSAPLTNSQKYNWAEKYAANNVQLRTFQSRKFISPWLI